MPRADAEHSRPFQIAAPAGEIRLDAHVHREPGGGAGMAQGAERAAYEGGAGGVRLGDDSLDADVIKPGMGHEMAEGPQGGTDDGCRGERTLPRTGTAAAAPQGQPAREGKGAQPEPARILAGKNDADLQGHRRQVEDKAGGGNEIYDHFSPLHRKCKDILSKLT